jgi:hypothetical protein
MNREEMAMLRKTMFAMVERLRKVGDYGAGAADIRLTAEVVLKLIDHWLERMK